MSNISEWLWLLPAVLTSSVGSQWEWESSGRICLGEQSLWAAALAPNMGCTNVVSIWENEFLLNFHTLGTFLASPCPRSRESLEPLSSHSSKTSWNFFRLFTLRWKPGAHKMCSHSLEVQSRVEHGLGWGWGQGCRWSSTEAERKEDKEGILN